MILSSTPRLTNILTHKEANQCTCHDVISRALRHAPAATQIGVADLCLCQLQCTYKCICIMVVRFPCYVVINTYN